MKRCRITAFLAILGLLISFPVAAFAVQLPDALSSVPADCPFVFGINVRQLTASPFFAKLNQEQSQTRQIGNELAKLPEKTGFSPVRDISSIVIAVRSVDKAKPQAVLIASGIFDPNRIAGFLRSDMAATEMGYGGASIWMIPETKGSGPMSGITFPKTGEMALGDMDSLKAVLDTRSGASKSILTNPDIAALLNLVELNDMLWMAGNSASVIKGMQIPAQLGPNRDSIQSIFGSLNFRDTITGNITVTALDPDSALKIANAFKGLIAYGQLPANKNPDAQRLLEGVTVSQKATQVTLAFNLPGDLIRKAGQAAILKRSVAATPMAAPPRAGRTWKRITPLPEEALAPQSAGVKPPVVLVQPLPPYTDEARRAKVEGKILLQLVVRQDGTPDSFKILQGLGYGLDESAVNTVASQWRFKPGTLNGKPVNIQILIEVSFRLYHKQPDSKQPPIR